MTPLQHAAFRGKLEVAELLMNYGANVNSSEHENGYTTLMFAALSGNTAMTRLVLEHGAKKDPVNSVGRNAAQMAAFVGQHQCVAVINNFFDKSDLEYYTVPRGQETEPKLPMLLVPALLKLLNMSSMHPVKISMHVQDNPELLRDSYKVCKVLDLIAEKAMKAREPDDIVAMKAHYFSTIIRKAKDCKDLDTWIKSLLRGRDCDCHPEFQDQLIRQTLKEFPFVDSILLQNMVRQLATTKIGENPTSLNILNQGINGQKFGFDKVEECFTCGELAAERKCSACRMAFYCNQSCQKMHWFTHKKFCKKLAEEYAQELQKAQKLAAEQEKALEEQKKLESEAAAKAEQTVSDTKKEGAEVTAKDQVEELEKATSETTNQVTGADTAES
ncbi:ankyrin repeat and MYND domain-containing protein 2-like isoform X2 [Dreissena polymorpha]|nr:ankyrin repeat and MYND domain-containing protein 2-like isoform X2 [Dreissena polymorpha]